MRFQDQSKSGRYPARVISHTTGADLVENAHLLSPETRASLEEHLKKTPLRKISPTSHNLSPAMKEFRKVVRERADNLCEQCGRPGSHAHHMLAKHQTGKLQRTDPRLGVFLCEGCHDHRKGFAELWRLLAQKRPDDIKWMRELCPLVVNKYLPLEEVNGSS